MVGSVLEGVGTFVEEEEAVADSVAIGMGRERKIKQGRK